MTDAATLHRLRRGLLLILLLTLPGIAAELVLLEHFDDPWQYAPFLVIALMLAALLLDARRSTASTRRAVMVTSALSFLSAGVGIVLHLQGNVAFERELSPELGGMTFVREVLTGATPILAPGTMALLGALGILYVLTAPARAAAGE